MARNKYPEITVEKILRAAQKLFLEKGYDNTTIQDIVDELNGQQEIVIKSLGKYINKCKFISGATILGDGEVALILDANAMF